MLRKKPLRQRFLSKIKIRCNAYVHTYNTRKSLRENVPQIYFSIFMNIVVTVINYYTYQFGVTF